MAINSTIIETFECRTLDFKYAVTVRPINLKDLDKVHEWLYANIPSTDKSLRWVSFARSQIYFKHQRDRDWFLLWIQ